MGVSKEGGIDSVQEGKSANDAEARVKSGLGAEKGQGQASSGGIDSPLTSGSGDKGVK